MDDQERITRLHEAAKAASTPALQALFLVVAQGITTFAPIDWDYRGATMPKDDTGALRPEWVHVLDLAGEVLAARDQGALFEVLDENQRPVLTGSLRLQIRSGT